METLVMPWGKFKGRMIEEIPSDYLLWLADNCPATYEDEEIANAAESEYKWRNDHNSHME